MGLLYASNFSGEQVFEILDYLTQSSANVGWERFPSDQCIQGLGVADESRREACITKAVESYRAAFYR